MRSYFSSFAPAPLRVLRAEGDAYGMTAGESFDLEELVPPGLCPLAYYSLVPYVVTLSRGGWFGWVRRPGDPAYRRDPSGVEFADAPDEINVGFPNEVLVQCPNPNVGVVFAAGPGNRDGAVRLRVLSRSPDCGNHHGIGQEFEVSPELASRAALFGGLLPYWLANGALPHAPAGEGPGEVYGHTGSEGTLELAFEEESERPLLCSTGCGAAGPGMVLSRMKNPCRFHAESGEAFEEASIYPGGMCPEAFPRAYVLGLARAYEAAVPDEEPFDCPSATGIGLRTRAEPREPRWRYRAEKLLQGLIRLLGRARDVLAERIFFQVREADRCPHGHEVGQRFELNLHDDELLCPASAYNSFWFFFLKHVGAEFRWGRRNDEVACPDCAGCDYEVSLGSGADPGSYAGGPV